MEKNVGHPIDVWARVVVGVLLLSLTFLLKSDLRWFGLIGLFPLFTAVIGWCPTWSLLGINTTKKTESE